VEVRSSYAGSEMTVTGLIPNLPLLDYVRDPAPAPSLSASLAHTLLTKSPRHAWHESARLNPNWQPDESEAADIGTIAHAILLDGDRSRIEVVHAPDWRSPKVREQRDAAWAAGKLPILVDRMADVEEVVHAVRNAIAVSELAEVFRKGGPEQTVIWQEEEVWCRARPDWMSDDRRVLLDLKTTQGSAEPSAWTRGPLLFQGHDLQAAHAMRGVTAVEKPRDVAFVFLVVETDPPYGVSLVGLSPAYRAFAEAKLASARTIWAECLKTNRWPCYPPRVAWAEPPGWAQIEWEARQAAVDDGRPLVEQLFGESS
jgi:hypothetical protein